MSNATSSLARAFTKRVKRQEGSQLPTRESSVRYHNGPVRGQISAPLGLISTTNVLAFNAPDIRSLSSSSAASTSSSEESDFTRAFANYTPNTSPETSSLESSPSSPDAASKSSPFFQVPAPQSTPIDTRSSGATSSTSTSAAPPELPRRAPSHTKRSHQLAHKRSSSRLASPPNMIHSLPSVRDSADIFKGRIDDSHPFGKELEQVNEVAESFGLADRVIDEEEQMMMAKGLRKFAADDYLHEIEDLFGGVFANRLHPAPVWI